MKALTKDQYEDSIKNGESKLKIIGGQESFVKGMYYHLRLDPYSAFSLNYLKIKKIRKFGILKIKLRPYEAIFIESKETFVIPKTMFGLCFSRVANEICELSITPTIMNPKIEEHRLRIVIRNNSFLPFVMDFDNFLLKIIFFDLEHEVDMINDDLSYIEGRKIEKEHSVQQIIKERKNRRFLTNIIWALTMVISVILLVGLIYWFNKDFPTLQPYSQFVAATIISIIPLFINRFTKKYRLNDRLQ